MYGNNFRPFVMPGNMPYTPYNLNPGMSHTLFNAGGIRSLFRGVHNINWSGMLNNVSRTLGVVRDAIPVVKEVGPMINNMKSMIKIASVFKDETDTKKTKNSTQNNQDIKKENSTQGTTLNNNYNYNYNNEPNFFL